MKFRPSHTALALLACACTGGATAAFDDGVWLLAALFLLVAAAFVGLIGDL